MAGISLLTKHLVLGLKVCVTPQGHSPSLDSYFVGVLHTLLIQSFLHIILLEEPSCLT